MRVSLYQLLAECTRVETRFVIGQNGDGVHHGHCLVQRHAPLGGYPVRYWSPWLRHAILVILVIPLCQRRRTCSYMLDSLLPDSFFRFPVRCPAASRCGAEID